MTITFENDNDVIVYAFEKIISYARRNRHIFIAQCIWHIASIIGLEQGLVDCIDKLNGRTTDQAELPNTKVSDPENQVIPESQNLEDPKSRGDCQDTVLKDCEEFLRDSRRLRDIAALKAKGKTPSGRINPTPISKKRLRRKDRSPRIPAASSAKYSSRIAGIDGTEIQRRRETGECLRCAWPEDRKGSHRVSDCRRPIKLDKGTAAFPKAKKYQRYSEKEISNIEVALEESSGEEGTSEDSSDTSL
jgi:hypothetical protein